MQAVMVIPEVIREYVDAARRGYPPTRAGSRNGDAGRRQRTCIVLAWRNRFRNLGGSCSVPNLAGPQTLKIDSFPFDPKTAE